MLNASDASVGLFTRGLVSLHTMLDKAERYIAEKGIEQSALLGARLAEDMYDLAAQAHWSCEGAKLAVQRLLGVTAAPAASGAQSFAALREQAEQTRTWLATQDPAALDVGLARSIEVSQRGQVKVQRGDRFLLEFAIPNFYFHLAAAYAILRQQGVPLQKGDFIGG